MAQIRLTKGYVTEVDDEDVERILERSASWYFCEPGYAKANKWNKETKRYDRLIMARIIMDAPKGMDVDHLNGDKLDNRKANLRICTRSENVHNKPYGKLPKSGYRGVFKESNRTCRWFAAINVEGKRKRLGRFDTPEEASAAYLAAVHKYYPLSNNFD